MLKYILFDLDGTISDSKEGILNCARYALNYLGVDESDTTRLLRFIGPSIKYSLMTFYGFSEEDADKGVLKYRERYAPIGLYENKPLPDGKQLFAELKSLGCKLALATSKPQIYAEKVMDYFGFTPYFDYVDGADFESKKSKSQSITNCIAHFGGCKDEYVMIGDRSYDIDGARNNGIASVGVKFFNYAEPNELERAGATFIVDTTEELKKIIFSSAK